MRFDLDTRALLEGGVVWLALIRTPRALFPWLDPLASHAVVFAALASWLTRTRPRSDLSLGSAVALMGLAAVAGYASAPAWMAGVALIGLSLGWIPLAAVPPGSASFGRWICAVCLGPWLEELLYRERLLRALRALGPAPAIAVTSLLFALPHPNAWSLLTTMCVGLVLGAAMWRAGSTALCFGYHAGLNAAALGCGVPPVRGALEPAPAAFFGTSLLLATVALGRRLRRRARCIAAIAFVPALANAEALLFEGELRIEPVASAFPPLSIEGTGVATVNASAGGIALETLALAGGPGGVESVPVTDPTAAGITGVHLTAVLGSGTLGPFQPPASLGSAQLTRAMLPVHGELRFCILFLSPCLGSLAIGLDGTDASGTVGLGVGGIVTRSPFATVRISLHGAPWTVRTASVPVTTPGGATIPLFESGVAHGPFSFTGSTALPGGEIQLVTPLRVETAGGGAGSFPAFGRLVVRFVPEPTRLLLLGAGCGALVLAARRRGARGGLRC